MLINPQISTGSNRTSPCLLNRCQVQNSFMIEKPYPIQYYVAHSYGSCALCVACDCTTSQIWVVFLWSKLGRNKAAGSLPEESVKNKRNKLGNARKDRFYIAKNLKNSRSLLVTVRKVHPSPPRAGPSLVGHAL